MTWVLNAPPSVNAESQYPAIIAVCVALSVVSVVGVLSRMYIRHHGRGLGYDDYMAALSMIFALAYSMLCIARRISANAGPEKLLLMCSSTRNEVRPRTAPLATTRQEPRLLHPSQLRRPTNLPAGRQLLQDSALDQLPTPPSGHRPEGISHGRQDHDRSHLRRAPWLCPLFDICM